MTMIKNRFTEKKIGFAQWILAWGCLFLIGNLFTEDILKSDFGFSLTLYWLYFIGTVGLISYEFIRREQSIWAANGYACMVWFMHAYIYLNIILPKISDPYGSKYQYAMTILEMIIVSIFLCVKILVTSLESKKKV